MLDLHRGSPAKLEPELLMDLWSSRRFLPELGARDLIGLDVWEKQGGDERRSYWSYTVRVLGHKGVLVVQEWGLFLGIWLLVWHLLEQVPSVRTSEVL